MKLEMDRKYVVGKEFCNYNNKIVYAIPVSSEKRSVQYYGKTMFRAIRYSPNSLPVGISSEKERVQYNGNTMYRNVKLYYKTMDSKTIDCTKKG